MIIKKYKGSDLEAINQTIQSELGPKSVIMMTRQLQKGMLQQFFLDDEYEVTAIVSEEDLKGHHGDTQEISNIIQNETNIASFSWAEAQGKVFQVPVTGPIQFDPLRTNVIGLLGIEDKTKSIAIAKLTLTLKQNSPYDTHVITFQEQHGIHGEVLDCLCRVFDLKHTNCHGIPNFITYLSKATTNEIHLISLPIDLEPTPLLSILPTSAALQLHLVISLEESLHKLISMQDQFSEHSLASLIVMEPEESSNILQLVKIIEKRKVPVSYLSLGSKFTLANSDDLEIRITNEKIRQKRS